MSSATLSKTDLQSWKIFLKDFIYLFLERGEGREEEMKRSINVREIHQSVASCTPPTGDMAHNLGMCAD